MSLAVIVIYWSIWFEQKSQLWGTSVGGGGILKHLYLTHFAEFDSEIILFLHDYLLSCEISTVWTFPLNLMRSFQLFKKKHISEKDISPQQHVRLYPVYTEQNYLDRNLDWNLDRDPDDASVYTGHELFNITKIVTLLVIVQSLLHSNPPNILIKIILITRVKILHQGHNLGRDPENYALCKPANTTSENWNRPARHLDNTPMGNSGSMSVSRREGDGV